MLNSRHREKLIHALVYFSGNVQFVGKTKLIKLLYFLDFESYEVIGKSVTGMTYYAFPMGPVPTEFYNDFDSPPRDFRAAFVKRKTELRGGKARFSLAPKVEFNEDLFSDFEIGLLQKISKRYFSSNANDLSLESHYKTGPWEEVYNTQGNRNAEIPYDLILLRKNTTRDREVMDRAASREALLRSKNN